MDLKHTVITMITTDDQTVTLSDYDLSMHPANKGCWFYADPAHGTQWANNKPALGRRVVIKC